MISQATLDGRSRINVGAPRLIAATLVLATSWLMVALWVGPHVVRSAYEGHSLRLINRLVTGQAVHSLQEYQARWSMFTWSGLGVLLTAGAFGLLATRTWPRWLVRYGPPLCAFLLVRALLLVSFAAAPPKEYGGSASHRWDGSPANLATGFSDRNWSRWDSHVYLSIARHGYEFYPCDVPAEGAPIARQMLSASVTHGWCGNAAWFPAYSGLIWALARAGIPEMTAGVLLSALFCLLALYVLWTRFLHAEQSTKALLCLLLASAFPGAVYYHAIFPLSLTVLLFLVSLHCARLRRWVWCGLAGAAAAATYPPGAFLIVALPIGIFLANREATWRHKLQWAALAGGLTSVGLVLVFVVQRLFVGAWGTFSIAQSAYASGRALPVMPLIHSVQTLVHRPSTWVEYVLSANILFVALIVILPVVFAIRARPKSQADIHVLAFVAVFWLLLLSMGDMSPVRKQSLLLPAVSLARWLPGWTLAIIDAAALLMLMIQGILFFVGSLI